jgi:hypothetical protein
MNAMKVLKPVALVAVLSALAVASPAHAKSKRALSDTGPLMMSGSMVPPSMARGSRAPDICRPVTIKRRPLVSLLSAR